MLAYVFWHRPRDPAAIDAYERAQLAFHRSLARTPPVGMCGSAVFRTGELPWSSGPPAELLAGHRRVQEDDRPAQEDRRQGPAYEDWYLLEDFAALGVLNEAAVGRGHRSSHDEAARRYGSGVGGLYVLLEGERATIARQGGTLGEARLAIWVARPVGSRQRMLGELLGDGMDPEHASLWRRQLVFGPAPEYCLLTGEAPSGVAAPRLPEGWTASIHEREVLWSG